MDTKQLTPNLSVAGQITKDDIADIAAQGFKVIINNRPDDEGKDQPTANSIKTIAKQYGITYIYQPVTGTAITNENAADFRKHIEANKGPILAQCRTGTRCTILWMLSQAKDHDANELLATATKAGYSLEQVRERLENLFNS